MKLYTEEELFKAMDFARGYHKMTDSQFIDLLTPIELPTYEEIENLVGDGMHDYYKGGFEQGAKYVIDKIKGGNK